MNLTASDQRMRSQSDHNQPQVPPRRNRRANTDNDEQKTNGQQDVLPSKPPQTESQQPRERSAMSMILAYDLNPGAERLGICLIFSNIEFSDSNFGRRNGGEVDEERLTSTFNFLNFKVILHKNLTAREMLNQMKHCATSEIEAADCTFALCLLSHGSLMQVHGVDGKALNIWNHILFNFTGARCPQLNGKPKLVLAQCCQGDEPLPGIQHCPGLETDAPNDTPVICATNPELADLLIAQAAPPYYKALRHSVDGAPVVKIFCETMMKYSNNMHLYDIFLKIKAKAADIESYMPTHDGIQLAKIQPTLVDTLRRRFYLTHEAMQQDFSKTTVRDRALEVQFVTILPLRPHVLGCNGQGCLTIAVRIEPQGTTSTHLELTVFRRNLTTEDGNNWTGTTINVKHGLKQKPLKVQALLIKNEQQLLLCIHEELNCGDFIMVHLSNGKDGITRSQSIPIKGQMHIDNVRSLIWIPHRIDGKIRRLSYSNLKRPNSWQHSTLKTPWLVSTNEKKLVGANYRDTKVTIFNLDDMQISQTISCNPSHVIQLQFDDLLIFEQDLNSSLWNCSNGTAQIIPTDFPYLMEYSSKTYDILPTASKNSQNIFICEDSENSIAVYSIDLLLLRLRKLSKMNPKMFEYHLVMRSTPMSSMHGIDDITQEQVSGGKKSPGWCSQQ